MEKFDHARSCVPLSYSIHSISVTNKGTNSNDIIDVIKFDSVLLAVINLYWFEWRFPIHKSDSVS